MLFQIIPFCFVFKSVPICHPPSPPSRHLCQTNLKIKNKKEEKKKYRGGGEVELGLRFALTYLESLRCCWRKVTFEHFGFSEAFYPRGMCISPVYPPHTHHPPPTLPQRDKQGNGGGEMEAIRRVEGQGQSRPSSSSFSPRSGQCNEFPCYPPLH